ncbi:cyclase family protein [Lentiprolixibacter aurantiacus]|uniref:Cyclase family protein n=1 Tax=Lentiprolixibacter aurantiacus TaxID=2993939 RepID=A0AAE3MLR6_9FLAO|nr:cyclase family protein [Lentiprolixibacter aurantiacus]MCX2719758.1 cyclase family protein [Lentiprolixibacter aurantiacus]
MKNRVLFLAATFILIPILINAQQSPAQYSHSEISNWGKWGKEDQKGAANYITPEVIIEAAQLIKKGKTFSLAIPIDKLGPVWPGRLVPHHTMDIAGADYATGINTEPILGKMKFADDYIYMALQGSTQWDALSHGWYGDQLYNGYSEKSIVSGALGGAAKLGIENVKESLIGRGVLIDILKYKGGTLSPGYGITRADVEGALEQQGTVVKKGDIIILRTGVVPMWYNDLSSRSNYFNPQTGIVKDVVSWIKEKEISAIAADNIGVERTPNEIEPKTVSPLHGNILRDLGVYIGEIWWLEELAEDCAKDGVYEFFLASQPLNIPGAVGSPINPIAIK